MKFLLLLLLIGAPANAQAVAPSFTTGSMTQTVTATQTINEKIKVERIGGKVQTWNGDNIKPVTTNTKGAIVGPVDITTSTTKFHVVDTDLPWQLEIVTRDAGVVETEDITRTIQTDTVTNTLSVFSQ